MQKHTLNRCVVLSNVSCALFKRLKDSRDPCYLCAVTFTCWVDIPCTEGTTVERIFLRYYPLEVNSFGAGWCVISAPRPACDWTVQFLYFCFSLEAPRPGLKWHFMFLGFVKIINQRSEVLAVLQCPEVSRLVREARNYSPATAVHEASPCPASTGMWLDWTSALEHRTPGWALPGPCRAAGSRACSEKLQGYVLQRACEVQLSFKFTSRILS